jgi:excisionase family DNA binding protein
MAKTNGSATPGTKSTYGRSAANGRSRTNGPTTESIQRLASATRQLAATIAVTERLAESRAAMLRTMDGVHGMDDRNSFSPRGIVSLSEAARRTGRHPEVLRRWCSDGKIPAVRIGRTWAITEDTVEALILHRSRSRPRLERATERP